METYKLTNGKTLEVTQDDYPYNPRHDDNLSTMICFHPRYNIGDKHEYNKNEFANWVELELAIQKKENTAILLPIYLYDHSGQTISTTPFGCRWDSMQIGFVFVSKEKLRNELIEEKEGKKTYITKKYIDRAMKVLLAEVDTYDNYIRGEVYGYILLDENGEVEDSCGGFIGSDIKTNGILDSVGAEVIG